MTAVDVKAKKRASYIRMEDGTKEDYDFLMSSVKEFSARMPDRLIPFMETLRNSYEGEQIDRYHHCLQTATRAFRDGADDETVVAALLHDIGDILSPDNHAEYAASIIRPFVHNRTYWMIKHHAIFQGYFYYHHIGRDRNERDQYLGHPCFEITADFCGKWDQIAFDPAYDTMPMSAFEPTLRRVFAREPWSLHQPDLGY